MSRRLGLTPVLRRFLGAAGIDSYGTGMSAAAAVLYFVAIRGFSAGSVAAAMSAGALLGLASPVPVGRLADRYGLARTYTAMLVLRGAGYVGYALCTTYGPFLAVTLVLLALETTTPPLQQSMIARLVPAERRVAVMSAVMAARNVGLGLGVLTAGAALATRSAPLVGALLALNGLSFLVLAAVVRSARGELGEAAAAAPAESGEPARAVLRNAPFLGLCGLNSLLLLHDSVLFVLLPLWTVGRLGLSPVLFSALLVLNTGLTVLLQLVLGRLPALTDAPGRTLGLSAALLVGACLGCLLAERADGTGAAAAVCVAAVAAFTLGENLHTLAAFQVSFELSPAGRRSEYIAAFNTGQGVQRVIGPPLMTAAVLGLHAAGWLLLAAVFAAGAAGFTAVARVLRSSVRTA